MRFVKDLTGLTEYERAKVKVFDNKEDFQTALDNGELAEDDLFAIRVTNGIFEDISEQLAQVRSVIPNDASPANLLVTQQDLQNIGGLDALEARVTVVEGDVSSLNTTVTQHTSSITQIGQVIPSTASSSNQLVTQGDLTTATSTINTCLGDLDTRVTDNETAVATNANHITGLSNSKVDYTEFCNCFDGLVSRVCDVETDISGKVDCSDYNTTMSSVQLSVSTNAGNISDLQSCPGLNCVGTLVAADLNGKADCSSVTALSSRVDDVENDISDLQSCAGLNCTGTLTSANFRLSGTTLTITV